MLRRILFPLGSLLTMLLAAIVALAWYFAMSLIAPVHTIPSRTPANYSLPYQDVRITTSDDIELAAWYIPAQDQPAPIVILLHGQSNNRAHMLRYANALHSAGYGALMIDLRNHGESGGDLRTFGTQEVRDVQAAVRFIREQHENRGQKIAIMGPSMGASISLMAAAEIPEIAAVVAFSPYSSMVQVVGDRAWNDYFIPPRPGGDLVIGIMNWQTGANYYDACPLCRVADIAPRPILLVHGTLDPVVPYASAERFIERTGDNVTFWRLDDVGHASEYWVADNRMDDVIAFIDDALK